MPSFTYTYPTSPNQYKLTLNITQGTGNVNTNSTPVSWSLQLTTPSNNYFQAIATYSAVINGVTVVSKNEQVNTYAVSTTYTLASGTTTVAHNADGTKTIAVSASFKTNDQSSYWRVPPLNVSGNVTLTTIPRYATITSFTASINDLSATMSWTADRTISQWRYSSNSGSSYSGWISANATSGSRSVSVSPGSTYGFRIQVRNSASGLDTTSSTLSRTATKTPSTLTLSTTSQNVGSNITWTVKESYDYTHKITYAFGNTSGYILGSGSAASNTASGTWTVPIALANHIPNATSGVGTIYVYTYYGSTHIGTKTYSFTAKVPNNATFQPTAIISSIVQGATLPSGITVYVQNKSKAKVTSTGAGKYGSTIKTYSVSVAGIGTYTGSVITSDFLRNSGTVRVTLTVTDSRGLKGSTYQDITVVAYSPPLISTFNATRSESTPTNILISYNASISSVSNQNGVVYRIRSLASGGSWVVNKSVTTGYTSSESFSINSDSDKSYTIEIYVADKWTSVTRTVQVGTAFTLIDFNDSGKGMAIGKVSESDTFEVALPAEFTGGIRSRSVNGMDMNTVTETGFYYGYNMTNSYLQAISTFIVIKYSNDWITQVQFIPTSESTVAIRSRHNGTTWSSWRTI